LTVALLALTPPAAVRGKPVPGELFSRRPLVGIYGGGNNETVRKSIESGVDMLFPSVNWWKQHSWLKAKAEQVHRHGMAIYPSLAMAMDADAKEAHDFARNHPEYLEKTRNGTVLNQFPRYSLSWGYPEVRRFKVQAVTKLVATAGCDGVLLDYTRYLGNDAGYSDVIVKAFKKAYRRDPFAIANDDPQWVKFRADYVTKFVAELRRSLHEVDKDLKIIACVNPDPRRCLEDSMQDWATWLEAGLIDAVVTMIYHRDTNAVLADAMIANDAIRDRVPHIPMIACWGGNLDTLQLLKEGALKSLQAGCPGVAIYRDDAINRLGLWPAIREISQWSPEKLRRLPVNYLLNCGFENGLENWAVGFGEGLEVSSDDPAGGLKCLKVTLPARACLRQLIDRGFFKGKTALRVTGRFDTSGLLENAALRIEVEVHGIDGRERLYRIPVPVRRKAGWHEVQADLPVGDSSRLKFVIVSVIWDRGPGTFRLDDLAMYLTDRRPDAGRFEVPPSAAALRNDKGVNLARGQIVKGSSFWENGFGFDNAVDGDLSDKDYGKGAAWHSQRPAKDQWLKIYLPATYLVRKIRMLNASAQYAYRTRDYKIEVSTDDRSYKQVAAGTLPNDGKTWTEVQIRPTPARYIKFTGLTGYHPDYAVGLKEIEVY